MDWKADTKRLHQVIDQIQKKYPAAIARFADILLLLALAERDATAAEAALVALGDNMFGNDAIQFNRQIATGFVARLAGDQKKARAAFAAAHEPQEKFVQSQPDYGPGLCILGVIEAGLGRKEEASRNGRRATALLPVTKDSINGPHMIEFFSIIVAWVGEKALACEQLAIATKLPGALSYGQLKLLPYWDPLRGDPRFEAIVASLAPNEAVE